MIIAKHLPSLQIILPLFGALLSGLSFNIKIARFTALVAALINFILSIYALLQIQGSTIAYSFGNWQSWVGIEHNLNSLNQPIIVWLNGLLLFILLFCYMHLSSSILQYLDSNKAHLLYSVLLLAHTGFIGMLSTNDLFNLYVFIEISSLSTYILVALGPHREALVGSFNYLIIGTISASFILLGIGFLFTITGHLNMDYVRESLLMSRNYQNLKSASLCFILIGCLMKIGFFPLHFWLVKIYRYTPAIILAYLGTFSSLISIYIFLRLSFVVGQNTDLLWPILKLISIFSMIFCAYLAAKANNLKTLIIYASISQIGVAFIVISFMHAEAMNLALKFILFDSLSKLALFILVSSYESSHESLNFNDLKALTKNARIIVTMLLICNAGLPLTGMFIMKLDILSLVLANFSPFIFIALILNSLLSLQYNYKIFHELFLADKQISEEISFNILPLLLLIFLQFALLIFLEYPLLWPIVNNFGLRQ